MEYTHDECPADLRGSVQGCLGTLVTFAQAGSAFLWGHVYGFWGPQITYSLGIVFLVMSLWLVSYTFSPKIQPVYKILSQIESPLGSRLSKKNQLNQGDQSSFEGVKNEGHIIL